MLRIFVILSILLGSNLPLQSFASEVSSISEIDVRPLEQNSTDIFSILQILMEARQAFDEKDYETAARGYDILVKYDPLMVEPIIGLAKSQLALNRSDLAEDLLLKTSISTAEIDILTAIATAMNLPPTDSELFLNDAVIKYPDSRLWNFLGDIFIKKGKWQKASYAFQAAEQAGQRPGLLSNNLGLLALHMGEFNLASQHLNEAVSTATHSIKFDNNRRLALLLNGDYIKALKDLTQDRSANLLTDAGFIAAKRGDKLLAKHLLVKGVAVSPKYNPRDQTKLSNYK